VEWVVNLCLVGPRVGQLVLVFPFLHRKGELWGIGVLEGG
jgi:hypothetical protein